MINPSEFQEEELTSTLTKLHAYIADESQLRKDIQSHFEANTKQKKAYLDLKELRQFLTQFFAEYRIRAPLTDEFIDATFREIDANHDNKIQLEELQAFAKKSVGTLVVQFENALEMQQAARRGADQGKRGEWIGMAKQLKIKVEMQERRA